MEALTILEPWASLIAANKKHIETRNWETKYRGKLFIHAGKGKVPEELQSSIDDMQLCLSSIESHPGNILAECNLVNCIKMDDKFIRTIKKNEFEYDAGVFTVGRYAWILADIRQFNVPVPCIGHQRIWRIPQFVQAEISTN